MKSSIQKQSGKNEGKKKNNYFYFTCYNEWIKLNKKISFVNNIEHKYYSTRNTNKWKGRTKENLKFQWKNKYVENQNRRRKKKTLQRKTSTNENKLQNPELIEHLNK